MTKRLIYLMLLFVALASGPGVAQSPVVRQKIDVSKLGPQVGQQVPEFSLKDQAGRTQTLQSVMGPRGAMLVFVRSADWCPFCRTQLVELQGRVEELRTRGISIIGISYDSQEVLAGFAKQHAITFPLLSDVGSSTIKRYGILNTVADEALGPNGTDPAVRADLQMYLTANEPAERHRGVPFPGTFIVDRQGRVMSRFFEDYYWQRSTVSNILLRLGTGSAPVQATRASTQHLDLRTYPSDSKVSLGTRFSIALEITPKQGMHVYAPGASQYRVINVNLMPQPFVRTTGTRYPASEMYHFKALNERVAVYQKPFTLSVDVVAEATAEGRKGLANRNELVLNGTLEYQACDDRICYNPVSVPLTWTVGLQSLVVPTAPRQPQR